MLYASYFLKCINILGKFLIFAFLQSVNMHLVLQLYNEKLLKLFSICYISSDRNTWKMSTAKILQELEKSLTQKSSGGGREGTVSITIVLSLPLNVSYPTVRGQERSVVAVDILVVEITTSAFLFFFPLFFLPVYLPYQIGLPPCITMCVQKRKRSAGKSIELLCLENLTNKVSFCNLPSTANTMASVV